jgi:hypothetical protein
MGPWHAVERTTASSQPNRYTPRNGSTSLAPPPNASLGIGADLKVLGTMRLDGRCAFALDLAPRSAVGGSYNDRDGHSHY